MVGHQRLQLVWRQERRGFAEQPLPKGQEPHRHAARLEFEDQDATTGPDNARELRGRCRLIAQVVEGVGDDERVERVVVKRHRFRFAENRRDRLAFAHVAQHLRGWVQHGGVRVERRRRVERPARRCPRLRRCSDPPVPTERPEPLGDDLDVVGFPPVGGAMEDRRGPVEESHEARLSCQSRRVHSGRV